MTELRFARQAVEDLERLTGVLLEAGDPQAPTIVELLLDGLEVLRRHPLIGRPAEAGLREWVISRGRSGHVALYDLDPGDDVVTVLAVRHQREAGFT